MNIILHEKYTSYIFFSNKVLNKKNGCNVPQKNSIKHNKQNNRMIKAKEVSRRTYYDEFDNTVNDDIQ